MNLPVQETTEEVSDLGTSLRRTIRALAGAKRISISKLGRLSGVGEQKLRDRLDDAEGRTPIRLSVEETEAIAGVLDVPLVDLIRFAQTGGEFPLRAYQSMLALVPDLAPDPGQQTLTFPPPKTGVTLRAL